uniref:Uncharacterized protein n=1 Tax=Oryza rufipogon TaxID=4529 RepID=A0A0E0RFY9_ORYRU
MQASPPTVQHIATSAYLRAIRTPGRNPVPLLVITPLNLCCTGTNVAGIPTRFVPPKPQPEEQSRGMAEP